MAGQLTQYGAEFLANKFTGEATPFIGGSAPGTWIVGQEWINGTTLHVYDPYTSAWVTGPYQYYMATLTSDPTVAGPGGGLAVNISDIAPIEDTTPGYLRQPVTFGVGSAAEPSNVVNTNTLTFGPYTSNQSLPVGYAALLAIPAQFTSSYSPLASTVLNGLLMYLWSVPNPQQVLTTQSISVAPSTFNVAVS
jgi:hypothetical protein